MPRFFARLFVALSFVWLAGAQAQAGETLKLAALSDYAPYSGDNLPGYGFSNDLTVQVMKHMGYTVEVTVMPWSRALDLVKSGQYDILPTVWYNKDRESFLKYSEPLSVNRLVFVHRSDQPFDFHSLDDLKGKTVGTVFGYAYDPSFLSSPLFKREEVKDIVLNLKKVAAGRIDLTLDDELVLKYLIQTEAPELASKLALTKGALTENKLYVAFSRKRPDADKLAADFNKGLADLKADGTYAKLLEKHKMN